MSTAAAAVAPIPQAAERACAHCGEFLCVCPALPCAGFLGPCTSSLHLTTFRNAQGAPECIECWRKRQMARCWR